MAFGFWPAGRSVRSRVSGVACRSYRSGVHRLAEGYLCTLVHRASRRKVFRRAEPAWGRNQDSQRRFASSSFVVGRITVAGKYSASGLGQQYMPEVVGGFRHAPNMFC